MSAKASSPEKLAAGIKTISAVATFVASVLGSAWATELGPPGANGTLVKFAAFSVGGLAWAAGYFVARRRRATRRSFPMFAMFVTAILFVVSLLSYVGLESRFVRAECSAYDDNGIQQKYTNVWIGISWNATGEKFANKYQGEGVDRILNHAECDSTVLYDANSLSGILGAKLITWSMFCLMLALLVYSASTSSAYYTMSAPPPPAKTSKLQQLVDDAQAVEKAITS
jgi:hypothetical protein